MPIGLVRQGSGAHIDHRERSLDVVNEEADDEVFFHYMFRSCPSTASLRALVSFRSRNVQFSASSMKLRNCAEAYSCKPHNRFQTCHAKGVIDAEIAEKGHLWTETRSL